MNAIINKLKDELSKTQIAFEIIFHEEVIKSKQDAAKYFRIEETAPTLILIADNTYYAIITSGFRDKVDMKKLKKQLNFKNMAFAKREEILENIGFEPGQVPLFGHNLPCIIDNFLFEYEFVYGGTGDLNHTLKIKPEDLLKINQVKHRFN